jgi:hypothetical protein
MAARKPYLSDVSHDKWPLVVLSLTLVREDAPLFSVHMRRFTRRTNGFSKKVEAHTAMVTLYSTWYNFVRQHNPLRVAPAMAAGISDRPWSMEDVVALIDVAEEPVRKRGPYKPRAPKAA